MKIKRFFMHFALLLLCVCMLTAEQPAEQNQAPADEKNILFAEEVYGTFLMHYFETKDARITDITVAYFNTQNEIKESMYTLLIGFYCELFKDSILKEAILEGIASLEKDSITDFFTALPSSITNKYAIGLPSCRIQTICIGHPALQAATKSIWIIYSKPHSDSKMT